MIFQPISVDILLATQMRIAPANQSLPPPDAPPPEAPVSIDILRIVGESLALSNDRCPGFISDSSCPRPQTPISLGALVPFIGKWYLETRV